MDQRRRIFDRRHVSLRLWCRRIDDRAGRECRVFAPGSFTAVDVVIPRLAIVRFPADVAGATQPAQKSATKPNYPLFVVVHGNGHNYTNYAFLLEHMARNGFIAVSIHLTSDRKGLGRANAFFDHINTIYTIFGASVQNNVAVLGHSRGGEAVFKIARLNESLGLGIGLKALIALGPTDQYGRETITGTTSKPLFVLYGAKDDDVSGRCPNIFSPLVSPAAIPLPVSE